MNTQTKIEIIDLLLPKLKEKGIGTLSEVLDNSPKPPPSKMDIYKIIEFDLEKFELVHFLQGRDNSTIDGMCRYKISPKGIDFVINKKSVAELYQNQNTDNRFPKVEIHNLVISENSNIDKISQESLLKKDKKLIVKIVKWVSAVIVAIAALATIYELLLKPFFNKG